MRAVFTPSPSLCAVFRASVGSYIHLLNLVYPLLSIFQWPKGTKIDYWTLMADRLRQLTLGSQFLSLSAYIEKAKEKLYEFAMWWKEGRNRYRWKEREREPDTRKKKENKMQNFFDATNFGQGLRISKVLWANRTRGKPLGDWKIFSYVNLPNVARPSCCYCCYSCCLCLCVRHPQTARTHRQKRERERVSICVAFLRALSHLECNKSRNKFCWHRRVQNSEKST